MDKIRVFEAFAGIGSPRMALSKIGIDFEIVAISEIDKFAIKSYEAIYGEGKNINVGDISKINPTDVPDHDLFIYGFPCQDISLAGEQRGLTKNSGTRSSLLWDCEKIIKEKRPKYLLMENVKNLVSKRFIKDFQKWLEILENLGYKNYYKVMNSKNYGIPQNRERVFCISILGEHKPYKFPDEIDLELRLKDLLEEEVDEKYYLSDEQVEKIKFSTFNTSKRRIQEKDWCDTLCARDFKHPKCVKIRQIGRYDTKKRKNCSRYRVYDTAYISPTLDTAQGGNIHPHIVDTGKIIASTQKNAAVNFDGIVPTLTSAMGMGGGHIPMFEEKKEPLVVEKRTDEGFRFFKGNICGSLRTNQACGDKHIIEDKFKVRKLTPKESWRLQGFPDWAFEKAEQVCSNTQLYKQAGNTITVDVLVYIFKNLLLEK